MPLRDGNSVTGAILMEIPLNAETLGPKYVDKIAELRNVMTDTEVKSR
jgi:hypothetical protein